MVHRVVGLWAELSARGVEGRPQIAVGSVAARAPGGATAGIRRAVGLLERREAGGGAAVVAAPGLAAFLDRDDGDHEGGDGVGPGPAQQGVGEQADQEDGREVGAEQGLLGVGDGGGGA